MCGICGTLYFDSRKAEEAPLMAMMKAMKHRGPDDEGVFTEGSVGLGFVRLSIIDLSYDGHQPMNSEDGNLVIVFNGEIYNYIEIRQQLSSKYTFKTKTDTEVILNAFREWGKDCLHHFNGMFAFAIYNRAEKELFVARDRFGIKPFYYCSDAHGFYFASEITPLLKISDSRPEADDQSVYDFLVYNRTNHTESTFFKGIKKLQHAHTLTVRNNSVQVERWYDLRGHLDRKRAISVDEFRENFISAVGLHLRSDVPVGACLSGGIDSSSIVSATFKNFRHSGLNTFSAVYKPGDKGDESAFLREYDSLIKNSHLARPDAHSFLQDMDKFVETLQEPVPGTSAYAEYKVYELAKKHVTVILNGQGADEEMAGYLYFSGFYYKELFRKLKLFKLVSEAYHDLRNHRSSQGLQSFAYFLLPASLKDKVSKSRAGYVASDFAGSHSGDISFLEKLYGSPTLHDSLVDHFEHKFEHHLIWGDRSSMRFSLESRYPFLDHRFVEMSLSLKNEQVINKGTTKYIFRQAMKGLVPEAILARQDKVGYETPEDKWFRTKPMQDYIGAILNSASFAQRGYVDPGRAQKLYRKHVAGHTNAAIDIWKCVHLELWFRKFVDQR